MYYSSSFSAFAEYINLSALGQNLINGVATQFGSGEEAVKNGRKGGINSGKARKQKADKSYVLPSLTSWKNIRIILNKVLTFVSPNVIIIMVTQRGGEMMSPKTGRPTDNPKNHETRIRMSDDDIKLLDYCTKVTGRNKSDIIREGIREVYNKLNK